MNELGILLSTGMTLYDAKRYLAEGQATIYSLNDYISHFDEYTEHMDHEEKSQLFKFLKEANDGSFGDNDLTTFDGIKYYIEYCL